MQKFLFDTARLQCSHADKLTCLDTVKKIYALAVLVRKKGILALKDAVEDEADSFLKTTIDSLLELADEELAAPCLYAYLAAEDYRGKAYLNNLLIVEGLLLILRQTSPVLIASALKGWFGVEFAQTYDYEMSAETARLNPLVPITQSAVPEFDRFARFSKVHTIKLLSELESSVLALALKGASDRVKHRFFFLMESSQAEEVRAEIDCLGCIRVMDVEEAQRYILEKAKGSGGKADGDA